MRRKYIFKLTLSFMFGIYLSPGHVEGFVPIYPYEGSSEFNFEMFPVKLYEKQNLLTKQEVIIPVGEAYRVVLDPRHKTELSAEVKSLITKITKNLGESFEEGELLVQLDDTIFRSNYNKAAALLYKAESEFEAVQELYSLKLASLFDLKEAEGNLASAEAEVVQARKNLLSCKILAPYAGVVVSLTAEEFELPQTGKSILKIIDNKTLVAKFLADSTLLSKIKIGQPLAIEMSETGQVVEAKVARIGGMIDPASSTIKIEAELDNTSENLKAGMTGLANFIF